MDERFSLKKNKLKKTIKLTQSEVRMRVMGQNCVKQIT